MGEPPAAPLLDLSRPLRVHVRNVGGAGMSAIATLLAQTGHRVSGHDPAPDTPFLAGVRAAGVDVRADHAASVLDEHIDLLVVSTATPADDAEVAAARAAGVPVVHRSAVLAALTAQRHTVAVAGTHGKTTTSALLATILERTGRRPGWVIGAAVAGLGPGADWGGDGPLVVEADESDGTFLALRATTAVVTNVEADHLDRWGTEAGLAAAFTRFAGGVANTLVTCADDPGAARLAGAAPRTVTYGCDPAATFRVVDPRTVAADATEGGAAAAGARFRLVHGDDDVELWLPAAPGRHNALNAAGAVAAAHALGVSLAEAAEALAGFGGVARRFEVRGQAAGVTFVDDYAHLPAEVAAAIAAARGGGWRRVVCAFQPHRYTRTEALARSFADAFVDADVLCVTDVYGAGEPPRPGVDGKLVVDAVLEAHPWAQVAWLPGLDDVERYLRQQLRPGDVCLTLGAGDLTTVPDRLIAAMEPSAGGG